MFILGLDGLEYSFVEKWDCRNLKQLSYDVIDVPIDSKAGVPKTPQVWASFLLGKWMDDLAFAHAPKLVKYPLGILKFLKRFIPLSLGLGKKILFLRNKVTVDAWSFPKIEGETFLDLTDSATINAPFYDFENVVWQLARKFGRNELSLKEFISSIQVHYLVMKKLILSEAPGLHNEIVFAYMLFPDFIQHLQFLHPEEIKRHYLDLDNFVKELKEKLEGTFIIVSDHGFDFGTETHSLNGFYSINKLLDFKPKRIDDFYDLILNKRFLE